MRTISCTVEQSHSHHVLSEGGQTINGDRRVLQREGDGEGEGASGRRTRRQVDVVTGQRLLPLAGNLKQQKIGNQSGKSRMVCICPSSSSKNTRYVL